MLFLFQLVKSVDGLITVKPCNVIRYSKFQSVGNITLHFPESFGGDTSQIHYIGFKGEATQVSVDTKMLLLLYGFGSF